jgi:hypothetical protein
MTRLLAILTIFATPALAIQGPSAYFDTDKSEVINPTTIAKFAQDSKGKLEIVRLTCHADSRATNEYNRTLAAARCESVAKLLAQNGLDSKKILQHVAGEEIPVVPESPRERLTLNRCVEIDFEVVPAEPFLRHRVQVAVGYAPSGINPQRRLSPSVVEVTEDWDPELGLGYSFRFTKHFNVGVEAFTNKSIFGTLGFDF